ncbi:hypothetical protein Bresa_03402|nr:hypothetical protein [Brenneria salicis ATCC 15712 = DSM 30166]
MDKLEKDGLIAFDGERITPLSQRNNAGERWGSFMIASPAHSPFYGCL